MLFFFSYARADLTPFLQRFYDDLRERVAANINETDLDKVAFRDAKSIEPGRPWPQEIVDALRTCPVFVYLHTPRYYTREGCGKEFRVVFDRIAESRGHNANLTQISCLQPVFWDGDKQLDNVPRAIADIQLTHEDYGEDYGSGLLKLIRTNPDKYWKAVYAIADRIAVAARDAPLPELRGALDWDSIKPLFPVPASARSSTAFASRKPTRLPREARFVWIVGKREELSERSSLECYDPHGSAQDWLPFLPDTSEPGSLIALDAAREVNLRYVGEKDVPQTQDELETLINDAAKAHTPIIIVTDLWSLQVDKYSALISMFDETKKYNCAVIFPWNFKDRETNEKRETLRQRLADIFPIQFHKAEPSLLFEGIVDADTFKTELSKLLTKYMADIGRTLEAVRKLPESSAFKVPPQLGPTSTSP